MTDRARKPEPKPAKPPVPEVPPRLRALEAFPVDMDGQRAVCLKDPGGFADKIVILPLGVFFLATLFDGRRTIVDIQGEFARRTNEMVLREQVEEIVRVLDENLFLDGPRYEAARLKVVDDFVAAPVRRAAHAGGAYPSEPAALRSFLDALLAGRPPDELARAYAGASRTIAPSSRPASSPAALSALIAPHIDFRRGHGAYAEAYRALAKAPPADLYVIFGTAHQGGGDPDLPFIFTRKAFETPLGRAETDAAFVDRVEARLGGRRLTTGEISHRTEHSVEFQVVCLQHLRGARDDQAAPVRVVPFICGSLHGFTQTGRSPAADATVRRFLDSLRATVDEELDRGRRVCLVAGADLAHIGTKFGDPTAATPERCAACERKDLESLERAAEVDGEGFFAAIAAEKDARNICGLSCIYAMLKTLDGRPLKGDLLAYGQAPDPAGGSVVSFASVGYLGA